MRERVEDLGRLACMLRDIVGKDIFDESERPRRPKDAIEWFNEKDDEHKDEFIHCYAYGLEDLHNELYELLSIAEGTDMLNEPYNG